METILHREVLIVGCSGAGKSTLSRKLALRWGLQKTGADVVVLKKAEYG